MTIQQFKSQLKPSSDWSPYLKALWYDGQGDWKGAHDIVDSMYGMDAAWVHAYLHRKEGDHWNANYWYNQANRTMPKLLLVEEWESLVNHFIEKRG